MADEAPASPATETPAAAPATPAVADIARANREKRAAAKPVEAAAPTAPVLTREQVLAELEADPAQFLALAEKVNKRLNPPTEAERIEQMAAELERLKGLAAETAAEKQARVDAEAQARVSAHVQEISKLLEDTDANGEYRYPTLATLDPDSVEEDPAATAYNAVVWAWEREPLQADGTRVAWDEKTVKEKFHAAFEGLEAHYAKVRTPKIRSQKALESPQALESPSSTSSSQTRVASEPSYRQPPRGNMTVEEAIRYHARQLGIR